MSRGRVVLLAVVALLLLFGWALTDPRLDVPVVSPVACAVKGDAWYGGGFWGPPGCYAEP